MGRFSGFLKREVTYYFSSYRANVYIESPEPFAYTSTRVTCNPGGADTCTPLFYEWCHANSDSGFEPTNTSNELQSILDVLQ